MYKKICHALLSRWEYALLALAVISLAINSLIFYPGYMSNDSISQLSEALGKQPITDLTPIAAVVVWKVLIKVTGHASSMLFFELSMLWAALCLLAVYVYKKSRSYWLSLACLMIGWLPFVVNISGVIWKDNQMAFALFLAMVGVLYFEYLRNTTRKKVLLVTIIALAFYAALVRYNAFLAILPLVFVAVKQSGVVLQLRWQLAIIGVFVLGLGGTLQVLSAVTHAQHSNPTSAILLDDIASVGSDNDINKAPASPQLKAALRSVHHCVAQKKLINNSFWICPTDAQRQTIQYADYRGLQKEWTSLVTHHPLGYMGYKLEAYLIFLFPPANAAFVWQDGIVANGLGQHVQFERLGTLTGIYVNNFGYKNARALFEPWLWFVVSVVLLFMARKSKEHARLISALSVSSLLYLLSYLPTGATVDYRYIYWPVLACLLALTLLGIPRMTAWAHRSRNK